jgi:hypothetical protein
MWAAQQPDPSSETAVNLRNSALTRLQFELRHWQQLSKENPQAAAAAMQTWLHEAALAPVRQPERRATLPPEEQLPWQALFDAVQQLANPPSPSPRPPNATNPAAAPPEPTESRIPAEGEGAR